MKKIKLLFVAIGITFGVVSLNSCKDACKDVVCQNSGTCTDGTCACLPGYTGTNCELEAREIVVGNFAVSETCSVTGVATYSVTVSKSSTDVMKVSVAPFGGYTGATGVLKLEGTTLTLDGVNGTTLTFASFNGTANVTGSTLNVSYSVSDGTNTETCTGTWTKQ